MEQKNRTNIYISLFTIVLSNALVVYGVVALEWNFFMVIYAYWFGEVISSVFDKIKVLTLKNRKELPALPVADPKESGSGGRFFFLFLYWVFIVILVGFVTAPSKTYGDNVFVILFLNKIFNLSLLCVLLGELAVYINSFFMTKSYNPVIIVSKSGIMNRKTVIMHISIIFGTLAWFVMNSNKFVIHIDAGKYGAYAFMIVFVVIRLIGDLSGLRTDFKNQRQDIYP